MKYREIKLQMCTLMKDCTHTQHANIFLFLGQYMKKLNIFQTRHNLQKFPPQFRDRIFWFPHNMDFRGRVYPCPPHLNHLSSDVFRSILQFARGEKLGPKGLRWLKVGF